MTSDELADFMTQHTEAMKKAALDAVIEKIKQDLQWQMPAGIQKAVNDFMAEEIAPAVVAALQSQKGEIIKAAVAAATQIGDALAVKMVENATKTLSGYGAKDLISKLVSGS